MAFTSSKNSETIMGNKRVAYGEYDQVSGDTGGDIDTGLGNVDYFEATAAETVVMVDGVATIVTADPVATVTGFWMAIGA